MVYLDTSVVLAHLLAENRSPPDHLWREPLVASRLLFTRPGSASRQGAWRIPMVKQSTTSWAGFRFLNFSLLSSSVPWSLFRFPSGRSMQFTLPRRSFSEALVKTLSLLPVMSASSRRQEGSALVSAPGFECGPTGRSQPRRAATAPPAWCPAP